MAVQLESIVMMAVLGAAATAVAEPASTSPPASTAQDRTAQIDPRALAALDRMGSFLRAQQSFDVRTTTYTDYVLDSGQKVRLSAHGELEASRPDHLRIETTSDRKQRQFFYDGKTFTMYAPRVGYYASAAAPPTIIELADFLEVRKGLQLPLVDLFRWGTPESGEDEITSAMYVGSTTLDGVAVDQYAFRQPGVDWQIWIQRGDNPLPRKLVLTTTDEAARPEHAIELTWDLCAKHDAATFTFVPRKGSQKIGMVDLTTPATERTRGTRSASR
jgi:hypothetical protein